MPRLTEHHGRRIQRILLVGDPGAGKTSAVGHLLKHGQKLFVADFDNKLDIIGKTVPAQYHTNLVYETLTDKVRPSATSGYPTTVGKPTAFRKFIKLTEKWVDTGTGEDFGAPESWDENSWLVVDSLTSMGEAVLYYMQDQRGKLGEKPSLPLLGESIARVGGIAQMLRSFPINTIMLAHLSPLSAAEDIVMDNKEETDETKEARAEAKLANPHTHKRYPFTLGKKLPRHIGGYFSAVLHVKRVGSGERAVPVICTTPDEDVDVSVPAAPKSLKSEMPIDSLYRIIQAFRDAPQTT